MVLPFEAKEACIEVIFVYNSVFKNKSGVVQELVQICGHEPAALREIKFEGVCFGCVESVSGKVVNCANFRVLLSVGADMLHKFSFVEGVSDEISIVVAVNSDQDIAGARLVGIFLEILATAGLATVTATTIVAAIIVASARGHLCKRIQVSE